MRNVTERRRTEDGLRESNRNLSALIQASPMAIVALDSGKRVMIWNPAAESLFGWKAEEVLGQPNPVVPEDRQEEFNLLQSRALEGGSVDGMEVQRLRKDGSLVEVSLSTAPLRDARGQLTGTVALFADITRRKQLEEQLLRAQRLETAGRIAGQVAHDFNNLLAPLMAYPELIKMQLPEGHPATQYCDAMLEAAKRMADINEEMMALGRRGHFDQELADLNHLVRQAVAQMANPPRGLRVELDLPTGIPPVNGSPAQLLRAISNLLSNAREAMQDLGLLTVKTENVYVDQPFGGYNRVDVGEYVRVSVGDSGCGISPEIRDQIFDAFFSTKSRVNRRGCGLGLSIVQAIVDDHHGYLDLESEVGRGTTFSIYFPACRERLREAPVERIPGGSETLLVVDDDRLQREVSRELLAKLGYNVHTVASGEDAVTHLRDNPADLVILDMIIPGGVDGAETYRRLLEIRPGQRAIIVSGFAQSERVQEAQSLGAGAYIRKPVTLERLALAVRQELDRER